MIEKAQLRKMKKAPSQSVLSSTKRRNELAVDTTVGGVHDSRDVTAVGTYSSADSKNQQVIFPQSSTSTASTEGLDTVVESSHTPPPQHIMSPSGVGKVKQRTPLVRQVRHIRHQRS